MKSYMAIDQFGNKEHGLRNPRKDLMARLGTAHCERMFVDGKDGNTYHVGYILRGSWFTVYEVTPMRKLVK